MGCWDESFCSNVQGLMTKIASRPIYGKNLKKVLLRNQEAVDIETWYTASGTQVLPKLFKWWHWVGLVHFYDMVKRLQGTKLIQHIVIYFQSCSNSAYPMYSGERYRTNVLWFLLRLGGLTALGEETPFEFVHDHIHEQALLRSK